jgi:hypothetical protein
MLTTVKTRTENKQGTAHKYVEKKLQKIQEKNLEKMIATLLMKKKNR